MGKGHISYKANKIDISGIRKMFELAQCCNDIIKLGLGEPDFDTPNHIKEAAKQALDEDYTHYSSNSGLIDLRKSISGKYQREYNVNYDPKEEIIVTAGGTEGLNLSLHAFLNRGDEVIVPNPSFVLHKNGVELAGGKCVDLPLSEENEFKIDPNELRKKVTDKTKMMIIGYPSNPTGAHMSTEELKPIAEIAVENNLLVISDEVYEKLIYEGEPTHFASLPGMRDLSITINSFSKSYAMAGWRVGWVTSIPEYIDALVKLHMYTVACVSTFSQRACITALEGSQDCLDDMKKKYQRRRDFIVKRLNEITGFNCIKPGGAFYVFPSIKESEKSSSDLAEYLITEAKVATVPGTAFGEYGEGHIRLSYANSMENIEEAMNRIELAMKKLEYK